MVYQFHETSFLLQKIDLLFHNIVCRDILGNCCDQHQNQADSYESEQIICHCAALKSIGHVSREASEQEHEYHAEDLHDG